MSLQNPPQTPISIGLAPTQAMGARVVGPVSLTFNGNAIGTTGLSNVVNDDLMVENEDGTINNIQSVYFDSSDCPVPVAFTIGDTQQTIIIPPKSQGYIPIMASNAMRYSAVAYGSAGAGASMSVLLSFLNVPCPAQIWSVLPSDSLVATATAIAAPLIVSTNNSGFPWGAPNRDIYVTGFDISGGGATAESVITATMTNIASSAFAGNTQTLSWVFDIPAVGTPVSISRRFSPPLRTIRSGATAQTTLMTVPSFGAGNLGASLALYYFLG